MTHIDVGHLSDVYAALSEPLRLRILRLLLKRELCVCEVMCVMDEPQYKISRHLAALKRVGLLRDWREGTWIHYEISPALPPEFKKALLAMRDLWDRDAQIQKDLKKLKNACPRQPGVAVRCC